MMRVLFWRQAILVLGLGAFLHGCTVMEPYERPRPPVMDRSEPSARAPVTMESPGVEVQPLPSYQPPPAEPLPEENPAVLALLNSADNQARDGDLDAAAGSLERAMRIEPRNARLWSELAAIRLQQHQPAQAEQLASKSNALAPGDMLLQKRNWRLIAQARRALGDLAGADDAERRLESLGGR